jgi:PhnB protein
MKKSDKNSNVPYVRKGFHTVTPFLMVDGATRLIEFMQNAFDAKVGFISKDDNGRVIHAYVNIGDSIIMVADTMEGMKAQLALLYVYVKDADSTFKKALDAGAKVAKGVEDQFYGDRAGGVIDEWGNSWWIATQVEELSDDELDRLSKQSMSQQAEAN